ncbi:MAG TPA: hypothetical protein VH142_10795 [Polyangiaceae bacterium]|nr:hypothetical protein [Polyangiaceae bacterium]
MTGQPAPFLACAALIAVGAALAGGVSCGNAAPSAATTSPLCPPIGVDQQSAASPPDGASLCPAGACNYQAQTGCLATQACTVNFDAKGMTATPQCDGSGSRKEGESCGMTAACTRGTFCVSGVCAKLCCGSDWSACGPGESCIRELEFSAGAGFAPVDAKVGLCEPIDNCDVFDTHSCTTDATRPVCRIVDPVGHVACQPGGDGRAGDDCNESHQCGAVLVCANADANGLGTCRNLCRASACGLPGCSASGDTCVHFARDPKDVGECTPGWKGPFTNTVTDAGTRATATDAG